MTAVPNLARAQAGGGQFNHYPPCYDSASQRRLPRRNAVKAGAGLEDSVGQASRLYLILSLQLPGAEFLTEPENYLVFKRNL